MPVDRDGRQGITRNVGAPDRGLRFGVGLLLISLGLFGPIGWWGAIGLVPLTTALMGNRPLYGLLGVGTCPRALGAQRGG